MTTIDPRFRVDVLARTPRPQTLVYSAMHQDYSSSYVFTETKHKGYDPSPLESFAGKTIVSHLLKGNRGHFGPFEHPQITFNAGYFPHSVMQQLRTHRVGISFDVQSLRYTSEGFMNVAAGIISPEEVFYLRPVGDYTSRSGDKYHYSKEQRADDVEYCIAAAKRYYIDRSKGMSEEHARGKLPFDFRQHFIMSVNLRSLMHLLDLRAKLDAQLEARQFCELVIPHFVDWTPEVAEWYVEHRLGKARLSP